MQVHNTQAAAQPVVLSLIMKVSCSGVVAGHAPQLLRDCHNVPVLQELEEVTRLAAR